MSLEGAAGSESARSRFRWEVVRRRFWLWKNRQGRVHAAIGVEPRTGSSQPRADRLGWGRVLLGIAVSGGCLVLLLWNVDLGRFWAALEGADYWWLIPSALSVGVSIWLKVLKWELLLRPAGRVSHSSLLYSMSVGYLVNTVLPGRLGELARVYLLARLERVSLVAVLSTVAVDRILDVVVLALLLAVVLPTANVPPWVGQSGLMVGVGGFGLLALCVALAYPGGQGLFLRCLAASPPFPGKGILERWARALCLGMQGLRGAGPQLRIAAVSLAIWIVTASTFFFGQLAFHIQAPFWAAVLALAVSNLGMVVPSSPGYIGVFHYLVVLALGAYGVEKEVALGFAVVVHLVGLAPILALGVFSLWRCGITLMGWSDAVPDGHQLVGDNRMSGAGCSGLGTSTIAPNPEVQPSGQS